MKVWRLLRTVAFCIGVFLLVAFASLIIYMRHLRASAETVIRGAAVIRTAGDAEHQIASLRECATFLDEETTPDGEHVVDLQVNNARISRLGLVHPSVLILIVSTRNNSLRYVNLHMSTEGRDHFLVVAGTWQWFENNGQNGFRLISTKLPGQGMVEIAGVVAEEQRRKAFAFNPRCIAAFSGCDTAEDILPGISQFPTRRYEGTQPK